MKTRYDTNPDRLAYKINAKESICLCAEMERLIEDADLYERLQHYESQHQALFRVCDIRERLDKIWDEQIELNEKILNKYHLKRKQQLKNLAMSPHRIANQKIKLFKIVRP